MRVVALEPNSWADGRNLFGEAGKHSPYMDGAGLKAVRTGRVYAVDGNQFFNRPGPRLAESLEVLAELLHPEAFDFGHKDTGWARP